MSSLQAEMLIEQKVANAQKSTGVAYLLWFFLGGFGGHRFYLGKTGTAVTQLIITIVGVFTLIPFIITGIWLLVDLFLIPGIIREHSEKVRHDARLEVALMQEN
ncbi:TM2 domain-containing protein [Pseudomonas synxantha]|uniref:TM2 domain-containing membrane protein YozV n=1 Tax=Pseudomonas synxantha TaxID=47883 RepID=A0ACC6JNT9_9PSED|nr:TM2 domain-containing protein [Pseudomonas synxantha]MDR6608212.1 TM2 domain-containing membrane protein YozV [Pseudomonas synxantha]